MKYGVANDLRYAAKRRAKWNDLCRCQKWMRHARCGRCRSFYSNQPPDLSYIDKMDGFGIVIRCTRTNCGGISMSILSNLEMEIMQQIYSDASEMAGM